MVKPSPPAGSGIAGAATVVTTADTGSRVRVGDRQRMAEKRVAGHPRRVAAAVRRRR